MSDRRFTLLAVVWLSLVIVMVEAATPTWLRIAAVILWVFIWLGLWAHSGREGER